ncbi:ABC transporter substrate-binding protein [Rothia mucilaginosa]|uniref:ABC transporter substrate-binding protein n=1 Tax=Rothia mucilaginosa TaxID=43675 RepID=UPI00195DAE72|nr:ABC transporter substrate-binding protein [Rothia mucilaginosa]VTY04354.1 Fe(3+)-citrate-binding protein YfmC [Rothia mucilaginosa]
MASSRLTSALALSSAALMLVLSGCGATNTTSSSSASASSSVSASASSSASAQNGYNGAAATDHTSFFVKDNGDGTKVIKDVDGQEVTIPVTPERVANLWHANNQVILTLGGAPKLSATTHYVTTIPWFRQVYPDITKVPAPIAANNDLNMEALLATKPDVVLVSSEKQAEAVRQAGLTAVRVGFSDMNGLMQTVNLTAEVLGTQGAYERAQKYNAYMQKNLKLIEERLKDLPDSERPKVMHIGSGTKVQNVSGSGIVIDEWIKIAGGQNVAADQKGMKDVSMEQITAYAPEVIIIGGDASAKGVQTIKSDAAWKDIPAVKNDKVIRNPYGTFNWDRYSTEEALQVLWAAKTLHPQKFTDIDMVKETQEFYSTFFGYSLSADDAQRILAGEAPEGYTA